MDSAVSVNRVHSEKDWRRELAEAVRDPDELIDVLGLSESYREAARESSKLFPLMVPRSYLERMERGKADDPLLRQVLPLEAEQVDMEGFTKDAVGDSSSRLAPGLLQKYRGRALLIATGSCAVHCRYCFRRHYPYGEDPRRLEDWEPALEAIRKDPSVREILLSGGDPLMLTDARLRALCERLGEIPHLSRLRVHSRLPIVLPSRVTETLIGILRGTGLTPFVVVHANHPREVAGDCAEALRRLVQSGMTVLNQAVLLRGVNDSVEALEELSERLIDVGVMPYYLHQLDRVAGAAHFEVAEEEGRALVEELRRRLPGYAVPQYVREIAGEASKTPLV